MKEEQKSEFNVWEMIGTVIILRLFNITGIDKILGILPTIVIFMLLYYGIRIKIKSIILSLILSSITMISLLFVLYKSL